VVALASRRTRRGERARGLPEGLVERGERPEHPAVREVREETGLVAEIRQPLGGISYRHVWDGERSASGCSSS
jgi:8-oxo-dGTP pyrophosphatase MutT (NUDIX family)